MAGDSLVSRQRNNIAALCLADPDVTHILWIDSDIGWEPNDVVRLLEHDADFICGLYPFKEMPELSPRFVFQPLESDDGTAPFDATTGLLEIDCAGTGFMLVRRQVFERLAEAFPASKIKHPPSMGRWPSAWPWLYNFFPVEVDENGILLSEDWSFCRRWRQIGGKVWADPTIKLVHYGEHAYRGDPMNMFQRTPAARQGA